MSAISLKNFTFLQQTQKLKLMQYSKDLKRKYDCPQHLKMSKNWSSAVFYKSVTVLQFFQLALGKVLHICWQHHFMIRYVKLYYIFFIHTCNNKQLLKSSRDSVCIVASNTCMSSHPPPRLQQTPTRHLPFHSDWYCYRTSTERIMNGNIGTDRYRSDQNLCRSSAECKMPGGILTPCYSCTTPYHSCRDHLQGVWPLKVYITKQVTFLLKYWTLHGSPTCTASRTRYYFMYFLKNLAYFFSLS